MSRYHKLQPAIRILEDEILMTTAQQKLPTGRPGTENGLRLAARLKKLQDAKATLKRLYK